VGDIEDDGGRATYELQPAWKMHLSEPLPNHVRMECLQTEECLGRCKCLRSVGGLMRTVERKEDLINRAIRSGKPNELPGHGKLTVDHAEVDALALGERTDLGAAGEQNLSRLDALSREDGMRTRLDNARLLPSDLADRAA
jgi:hypothetical protein